MVKLSHRKSIALWLQRSDTTKRKTESQRANDKFDFVILFRSHIKLSEPVISSVKSYSMWYLHHSRYKISINWQRFKFRLLSSVCVVMNASKSICWTENVMFVCVYGFWPLGCLYRLLFQTSNSYGSVCIWRKKSIESRVKSHTPPYVWKLTLEFEQRNEMK